jgi:hypothetical protein
VDNWSSYLAEEKVFFCYPKYPDRVSCPHSILLMENGKFPPGDKAAGT